MARTWISLFGGAALALSAAAAGAQDEVIRIGTEGAYPPFNFTDASGELVGFEIDMARALCERMGATCEFVAQDWDGIIPALLNGRYDAIIAGMSITDERRERIAFSHGYATIPAQFVATDDSPLQDLETVEEIRTAMIEEDMTVGVQVATSHQNFLENEMADVDIRRYDTQEQLGLDLASGRVDAGLADSSAWEPFLTSEEGAGFSTFGPGLTGADYPIFGEGMGIGLRKADTALQARFNAALCEMQNDGSLSELAEKWFGFDASMPCPDA